MRSTVGFVSQRARPAAKGADTVPLVFLVRQKLITNATAVGVTKRLRPVLGVSWAQNFYDSQSTLHPAY